MIQSPVSWIIQSNMDSNETLKYVLVLLCFVLLFFFRFDVFYFYFFFLRGGGCEM